jgi:hypothetical protein
MINHLSRLKVFELCSHKRRSFAGLDMQKFNDLPQAVVMVQHEAVFDV